MSDYISRRARGRKIEPGSVTINRQRREQLLVRVRETAAGIKARP